MVRRRGLFFGCISLVAPTLLDAYEHSTSIEGPEARKPRSSRIRGDSRPISTWVTPISFDSSRCLCFRIGLAVSLRDPSLPSPLRPSCRQRSPENLIADESPWGRQQNADPENG